MLLGFCQTNNNHNNKTNKDDYIYGELLFILLGMAANETRLKATKF